MNNLLISVIILSILVSVGAVVINYVSQITDLSSRSSDLETHNIAAYKLINYSSAETVFIIVNYGYSNVYVEKILCLSNYSSDKIVINISRIIDSRDTYITRYKSDLGSFKCFVYGDKWFEEVRDID